MIIEKSIDLIANILPFSIHRHTCRSNIFLCVVSHLSLLWCLFDQFTPAGINPFSFDYKRRFSHFVIDDFELFFLSLLFFNLHSCKTRMCVYNCVEKSHEKWSYHKHSFIHPTFCRLSLSLCIDARV